MTRLVLCRVHLDLHCLLASGWISDEVFLELGCILLLFRLLLFFLWLGWLGLLLLRLGSGLLRWLSLWLRWCWLGLFRLRLLFLLFFSLRRLLLSLGSSFVLISCLKHLAHHVDSLIGLELFAATLFLFFRFLCRVFLFLFGLGLLIFLFFFGLGFGLVVFLLFLGLLGRRGLGLLSSNTVLVCGRV